MQEDHGKPLLTFKSFPISLIESFSSHCYWDRISVQYNGPTRSAALTSFNKTLHVCHHKTNEM